MMNVTYRQVRYWNLHYDIRDITTQKDLNRHLDDVGCESFPTYMNRSVHERRVGTVAKV